MSKKALPTFLTGTLILTASSIVVKVIGSLNWIILSRILGGEGIGLYQMSYPIYILALAVSSAGIPVAISIVTAEKLAKQDYLSAHKAFRTSMSFLFFTGLFFSLCLVFGANFLVQSGLLRDARAYYAIIALAPAVFFVTFLSCFRGYLQGWQTMTPTAVSEIVEQLLRVITMILMAKAFLSYGLEYAAAGASLGAAVGSVGALLVLVFFYKKMLSGIRTKMLEQESDYEEESKLVIIKRLLRLALPVSASSLMLPIVANMDLLVVPVRLEAAGFTVNQATELFGHLTGMAVPLVNLATILTAAMAISLVPTIAKFKALGQQEKIDRNLATAFNVTAFISIPCSVGLFVLAQPVATLVYNAPAATHTIQAMSLGIFALGLHQVSTGALQGLGYTRIPMINMVLAALLKILLNYYMTAVPALNIKGAALASVIDIGFAAVLNLYFIRKYVGYQPNLWQVAKISFCSLIMGIAVYFTSISGLFAAAWLNMVLGLLVSVPVYLVSALVFKALDRESLEKVPFIGSRLSPLLNRIYNS